MREYQLPVISPTAIQAYLDRPAGSYDFLKEVPREELVPFARQLGFRYLTDPRISQLVCNIIAAQEPRYLFYKDMGGGKTKAILDTIRFRKSQGHLQRALIAMPEFIHIDEWKRQVAKHAPDLRYVELVGDREERFELVDQKADVYFINYAGLPVYMSQMRHGRLKNKKVVDTDAASLFASMFNFVVFEELHRIRDHSSLTFRLCSWLSAAAAFVYGLTGTPFRRNLMMLWAQFKLVDEGETFGALGMYQAAMFNAKKRMIGKQFAGYEFTFNKLRSPALHRLMKNKSIVYNRAELKLELPHRTSKVIEVRMSKEQRGYYDRIKERMKEAKGDYQSLDNVYTRFRQCASGFLSLKADDESRIDVDMDPNPKLDAMKQVLIDMPVGEKVVIFHRFYHSGNKLRGLLRDMDMPFATLYGRARMRADGIDPDVQYRNFLESRSCLGFILQHEAGSEAINPHEVCDYLWFYERPDDPIISEQAENRVDRPGKSDPVLIGDLVVQGTVEEQLLENLVAGRSLFDAVMKGEVPCEAL